MNSKHVNTSEWFVQRVGISLWFRDCGKARWKLREQPFIMRHEQYAMNSVCAAPKAFSMRSAEGAKDGSQGQSAEQSETRLPWINS